MYPKIIPHVITAVCLAQLIVCLASVEEVAGSSLRRWGKKNCLTSTIGSALDYKVRDRWLNSDKGHLRVRLWMKISPTTAGRALDYKARDWRLNSEKGHFRVSLCHGKDTSRDKYESKWSAADGKCAELQWEWSLAQITETTTQRVSKKLPGWHKW